MSGPITTLVDGNDPPNFISNTNPLAVTVFASRANKGNQKATLSNTTAETTILTAGAAGIFNNPFIMIFANSGAAATKVDIRDSTGGAIRETFYVPAGDTRGFTVPIDSALEQTTAANNWTAQCSVATTAMEISTVFVTTTS